MTAALLPWPRAKFFAPNTNYPLSGGKVYTYAAGTSTPLATYSDYAGTIPNANPVILDANGEAAIYLSQSLAYKINILDASNVQVPGYPVDNIMSADFTAMTLRSDLANTSNPALGDALVGVKRTLENSIATNLHGYLDGEWVSIFNYMTAAQIADYQSSALTLDLASAIQAAFDNNPAATIFFPLGTAKCASTITLTNASGKNFQGRIISYGGGVTFTNDGLSTDTDIAMQRGFAAYPVTNAVGGDITGMRSVEVKGLTITGPAHGTSFYIANSQGVKFRDNITTTNRYGMVTECCIHTEISGNKFVNSINAGLGMLFLNDTARVWYTATPATGFWNDSPNIVNNMFVSGSGVGRFAGIIDHGSRSEAVGRIDNNLFFTDLGSPGAQMVYGYIGRNCNRSFGSGNWFENIPFAIRILTTNAILGAGTAIPYISASEPSGTITYNYFPDGYSSFGAAKGCHFVKAVNDIDFSGVNGTWENGPNFSQGCTGNHLYSSEAGSQICVDLGDVIGTGIYKNLPYGKYYRVGTGDDGTGPDPGIGVIGEYIEGVLAIGSAHSLTTTTVNNVASISLTAGDWEIGGNVAISFTGATASYIGGGVGTANNWYDVDRYGFGNFISGTVGTIKYGSAIPVHRRKLGATTTIYLNASVNFTVGSAAAYGSIWARRVR